MDRTFRCFFKNKALLAGCLFLFACSSAEKTETGTAAIPVADSARSGTWPHAVTYEIFVQSFYDSDGDSIGDIRGMTSKLDYLEDLGVQAVWLMPIMPSPSYHKYDVTDYKAIHPDYGTMADFKNFVREAHERGIHVVIDMIINHTSNQHPWFQEALKGKDNPYRDYYVWADRDSIAEQIAKKEVTLDSDNITQWHDVAGDDKHYYGFFWSGMPDLNFDNPEVREEVFEIGRFWLEEVGVDGFRLDAARHIYPDERAKDNHRFWEAFRKEMEKVNSDVYLVGEVWADAKTVAPYLKGLSTLFNFDMGYAITNAVMDENCEGLVSKHRDIRTFYNTVTDDFIDATFLTNHDQNRIRSVLGGDIKKTKVAASLLLTLPGAPYIYYGEEIGMLGEKPDEHIREPFIWDKKGQDPGQPAWVTAKYSTAETVTPLSVQLENQQSLFNHYKSLIHFRNSSRVMTQGRVAPADLENSHLCAFFRTMDEDSLLVIHNLSGQPVTQKTPGTLDAFDTALFSLPGNHPGPEKGSITLPAYGTLVLGTDKTL